MDRQPLLEEHRGSHEDRGGRTVRIASPGQRGWLSEQLQQQRSGGGGSFGGGVTPTLQESPSDHAAGGAFVSAGYQQGKLQPRPNMVLTRGAPAAASRARCVRLVAFVGEGSAPPSRACVCTVLVTLPTAAGVVEGSLSVRLPVPHRSLPWLCCVADTVPRLLSHSPWGPSTGAARGS